MPLYEFVCNDCDRKFDTLVANREAAEAVTCNSCESVNVRRLISTFAMPGGFDDQMVAGESFQGGGCCGGSCGCGH